MFFHCLLVQRFVSIPRLQTWASTPATSSLDDVRAERAAIALSVGLSWPPVRQQRFAGRPWQRVWERGLQEHIFHHHEFPHGVRSQPPDWRRPGETIALPLTQEEIADTITPCAALAAPATPAAALVEDEPSGSGSKRRRIHADPIMRDWFLGHVGSMENGMAMGRAAVLV